MMPAISAKDLTIGVCHTAYQIEPVIRERLPEVRVFQEWSTDAMIPRMPEVDVLVISGAWDNLLLERSERLKWIQSIGMGYNQFPLEELRSRNIRLTNAVGVNDKAVSEHALALILALARRLHEARDNQSRKFWRPAISDRGSREDELGGKTLGIVGLGAIGNQLATLGKAFDMNVIGTKSNPDTYHGVADTVLLPAHLGELLDLADYVVLCCPLNSETKGLIGETELKRMRSSAHLINVARGPVVVEEELVKALRAEELAGAALDVTVDEPLRADSQLWEMPNVLITPHTAGETSLYEKRLVDKFVENVRRWEQGEAFVHRIV